ncbi:hypothetical protein [Streptomyces microflavus]|uniref:hypothetical protein n=1 Tax=Streptomyces microflavus TaxID=1919 RepID=UPI0035DFD95A
MSDPLIGVVPGPVMRSETPDSSLNGFLDLSGLLLGVGAVFLLFRADLFDFHEGGNGAVPGPPVSSSITVTSMTGTVAIGPDRSMLDESELHRGVESLTQGADKRRAFTVVVQDRLLTVVITPAGAKIAGFEPTSLPLRSRRRPGRGGPDHPQRRLPAELAAHRRERHRAAQAQSRCYR